MNKTAFIAYLESKYKAVSSVETLSTDGAVVFSNGKAVRWYTRLVFEAAKSAQSQVDIAVKRTISYYVYDEGGAEENVSIYQSEPVPGVNLPDVATTVNDSYAYANIFNCGKLRDRVLGFIIKAVTLIYWEGPVTDHAIRLKLMNAAMHDPLSLLNDFMVMLTNDAALRTAGNGISEVDLETKVNSWLTPIATARYS